MDTAALLSPDTIHGEISDALIRKRRYGLPRYKLEAHEKNIEKQNSR